LAHGFLVLSESADFLYKATTYYEPQAERSLRWNDPALGIEWPELGMAPILSSRDATAPSLAEQTSR
jgi:dTDP-4-dehydrorhamnose 3,5-epimerase